jgi:ABC-type Zn2+ transport system substrate-binding protein/surface adhesin
LWNRLAGRVIEDDVHTHTHRHTHTHTGTQTHTHIHTHTHTNGRRIEDEMSYWMGPTAYKLLRLFLNLVLSIHLFSCAYWRTKVRAKSWA